MGSLDLTIGIAFVLFFMMAIYAVWEMDSYDDCDSGDFSDKLKELNKNHRR